LRYALGVADGVMSGGLRALSRQSDPCDRPVGGDGSVEFLLPGRWRRPLGGEGDSQVVDDLVYDSIVVDEGYYLHLGSAGRAGEWIDLINLPDPPTQMGSCPLSDALEGASADVT
jgi:hypothetical protein